MSDPSKIVKFSHLCPQVGPDGLEEARWSRIETIPQPYVSPTNGSAVLEGDVHLEEREFNLREGQLSETTQRTLNEPLER